VRLSVEGSAKAGALRQGGSFAAKYFSHRRWADKVYNPDIVSKSEKLYKKPGYTTQRYLADFISCLVSVP
jgi:hypothetical protein